MKAIDSIFTRWELTDQEQLQSNYLPVLTLAKIQNMLVNLAQEKLSLPFDVTCALKSVQREAELQGQILILQQLINEHEGATKELEELQKAAHAASNQ